MLSNSSIRANDEFLKKKTQNSAFTTLSGFLKQLQYEDTCSCPVKFTKHLLSTGPRLRRREMNLIFFSAGPWLVGMKLGHKLAHRSQWVDAVRKVLRTEKGGTACWGDQTRNGVFISLLMPACN